MFIYEPGCWQCNHFMRLKYHGKIKNIPERIRHQVAERRSVCRADQDTLQSRKNRLHVGRGSKRPARLVLQEQGKMTTRF